MKLPLDTRCLIGALTDAPQLDAAVRQLMADADGVWFSEASAWELGLKWRKGKIALSPRRVLEHATANGLRPLAVQMEAMLLLCEPRQTHGDPFDRLLCAQARLAGYRLLSIDRTLASFGAPGRIRPSRLAALESARRKPGRSGTQEQRAGRQPAFTARSTAAATYPRSPR